MDISETYHQVPQGFQWLTNQKHNELSIIIFSLYAMLLFSVLIESPITTVGANTAACRIYKYSSLNIENCLYVWPNPVFEIIVFYWKKISTFSKSPKFEFLTFNFRKIVLFWHPLRLFQFPLTWDFLQDLNYRIGCMRKHVDCNVSLQNLIWFGVFYISVSVLFLYQCIHCNTTFVFVIKILYAISLYLCLWFDCYSHIVSFLLWCLSLENFIVPLFNYSARSCSPWFCCCRFLISDGRNKIQFWSMIQITVGAG